MKKLVLLLFILPFIQNTTYSQTGWFIQPSFTSMNLYDCKQPGITSTFYLGSDSGTVFTSINNGYNWSTYDFYIPWPNTLSIKYIQGHSNYNFSAVGQGGAFGYKYEEHDSVMRVTSVTPRPTLEAYSALSGGPYYTASVAAGTGGKFYIRDFTNNYLWRTANDPTALANGRQINYSLGALFVGNNGLIMKADSIGSPAPNGEFIKWRIIPSGTTKNLNCIMGGSGSSRYLIVGDDGTILKSTDFGNTWTQTESPTTEDLNAVWHRYAYLICGDNGTILRSYDINLEKWYKQITPTTADLFFIMDIGYSDYISGGENGIFLRTTDGGGTLKRFIGTSIIEGFYNSATNTMVSDTISVTVRSAASPYNIISTGKDVLSTTGYGLITIGPTAFNSVPYYIQINHRNSLETWSKTTQVFTNNDMYYDFYDAVNKAYGDNLKQVDTSPVRFAFYSGDINQDGSIDGLDLGIADNDAFNFVAGYVKSDVNGDNIVDGLDISKVDNNAFNFVSKITPP